MQLAYTLAELTEIVKPQEVRGTATPLVSGIGALSTAVAGDLSFLGNAKYRSELAGSRASVVLVPAEETARPAEDQVYLVVESPSAALARVCACVEQALWPRPQPGIHPSAVVDPAATVASSATVGPLSVVGAGAVIGERTHLQGQVYVDRDVRIGADCWLMPGTIVSTGCELRDRVRLSPGVVVGADGYGYEFVDGRHAKVPQVGMVLIESDVEVGANSTIDRARFSRTVIGEGTKIDNLVQVAHNVVVGKHCLLCAQVGIAGSTTIGDYVIMGGQAGAGGHLTIGDRAKLGGRAGVTSNIDPDVYVTGMPAMPHMLERRILILSRRLPELFKRVDRLLEEVETLKKASAS